LYYRRIYEAGKKYPVITAIHGGPSGADKDLWGESWRIRIQLSRSAARLCFGRIITAATTTDLKWVNPFAAGKYYEPRTPDINAGVDYLIAKGMGDPDRVATMGWSTARFFRRVC